MAWRTIYIAVSEALMVNWLEIIGNLINWDKKKKITVKLNLIKIIIILQLTHYTQYIKDELFELQIDHDWIRNESKC